jgi:hypothetical protein
MNSSISLMPSASKVRFRPLLGGIAIAAAASLAACSSSSSGSAAAQTHGSGSATGTVNGASLPVADAYSFENVFSAPNPDGTTDTTYTVSISLVSFAGICAWHDDVGGDDTKKSSSNVCLDILSGGAPVAPGTYGYLPADGGALLAGEVVVSGAVQTLDENCDGESIDATDGTVTVTSVDDGVYVGTYSLTFPSGTITGSFSASDCPEADAGLPTTQNVCM